MKDGKAVSALAAGGHYDPSLKEKYGLTEVPTLPVVDMVIKHVSLDSAK